MQENGILGLLMGLFGFESTLAFGWAMVYVVDSWIALALWAEWRHSGQHKQPKTKHRFLSYRSFQKSWLTSWRRSTAWGVFLFAFTTLSSHADRPTRTQYPREDARCTIEYYNTEGRVRASYSELQTPGEVYTHEMSYRISRPLPGDGWRFCSVTTHYKEHGRYQGHYLQHALQMGSVASLIPVIVLIAFYQDDVQRYNHTW
jgi:hypothetical protein